MEIEFDDYGDLDFKKFNTEERRRERVLYHIRDAHERKDALEYYVLCEEIGEHPRDLELYNAGKNQYRKSH